MTKTNFYLHVTTTPGFRSGRALPAIITSYMWPCLRNVISTLRPGGPATSHLPRSTHEVEYASTPASAQGMCKGSQNM